LLTGVLGDSLVAIQSLDGKQSWTVPTSGWLWGSPVVRDGIAYFGDATPTWWTTKEGEGKVYAVDLTSRETVWQKATAAVSTSPVIVDGHLIVAFEYGHLTAYAPADGTVVWEAQAVGTIQGDPVVADGKVIVGVTSTKTVLQAFDSTTGTPAWSFPAVTDS
jgi:outer membrane protein assembly factor BamB